MANVKSFKKGDTTKLSDNFSAKEFDCKCDSCDETLINLDHVQRLQQLRDDLGCSITINSAYRCPEHNAAVGGEKNSMHMKGHATDIVVKGMTPNEVADACEKFDGLGRYDTFTHIDSRGRKARWDLRKINRTKTPTKKDLKVSLKDIEKNSMFDLTIPEFSVGMLVVTPSSLVPHLTEDKKYVWVLDVSSYDWIQVQDTGEVRYFQSHLFIEANVYYTMTMWLSMMRVFELSSKDL